MSAENGGFSFEQIPVSLENLILKVDQMDSAILFTRQFRITEKDKNNEQLFSLMLPIPIRKNDTGDWVRI